MHIYLKYGAIGLGCVLALLAFRLLHQEQKQDKPRSSLLKSIRTYMLFCLALSLSGFGAELVRPWFVNTGRGPTAARSYSQSDDYEKELQAARAVKYRRRNQLYKVSVVSLSENKTEAQVLIRLRYSIINIGDDEQQFVFNIILDTSHKFAAQCLGDSMEVVGRLSLFQDNKALRSEQEIKFKLDPSGGPRFIKDSEVVPVRLLPQESVDVDFYLTTPIGVWFPYSDYLLNLWPTSDAVFQVDYGGLPLKTKVTLLRGNQDGIVADRNTATGYEFEVTGAFLQFQGTHFTVSEKRN